MIREVSSARKTDRERGRADLLSHPEEAKEEMMMIPMPRAFSRMEKPGAFT
jgi:hypothetical protein